MYIRKEAVLSSQIEGTQSSLQDVLAAEAKIFSQGDPGDVGEVLNYMGLCATVCNGWKHCLFRCV